MSRPKNVVLPSGKVSYLATFSTCKQSKMEHRHRSSEPKGTNDESDYDKENVGFQILSPQPQRTSYLPRIQRFKDKDKKTLVLDLDETLVHSSFDKCPNPDIVLSVNFEGKENKIYVKVRPGAIDFLRKISKIYEVVVFTASVANYADPLVDILDVDSYGFYKLFREHCTYNGNYIKDLSKLGRELKDCIIVDNLPKSYANQPENGLPILSWYEDPADIELDKLYPLLIMLSKVKDVRPYIKKLVVKDKISYERVYKIFEKRSDCSSLIKILNSLQGTQEFVTQEKLESVKKPKNEKRRKYNKCVVQSNENIDSTNKNQK